MKSNLGVNHPLSIKVYVSSVKCELRPAFLYESIVNVAKGSLPNCYNNLKNMTQSLKI